MKFLIGCVILSPLVSINYLFRRKGLIKDKWFFADELLIKWRMIDMRCYKNFTKDSK